MAGSGNSSTDRDALIEAHLQKLREQLKRRLPDENATLDQIEEAVGRIGREVSQDLQRRVVDQRASRQARLNQVECSSCGARARYKGRQPRGIVTCHGVLVIKRSCYYCPFCQQTLAPLDAALGLDSSATTIQVRLWVALVAGQLPFAQAATTLQMLTHVSLSAATMERLSVTIGASLRKQQHDQARQHQSGELPLPRPASQQQLLQKRRPHRLYVGMDGVFVPLREPWRKDKSEGDLTCRWGECKVGVVYEAFQNAAGKDERVRTRAYTATLQNVDAFAPLLGTLAHQQGHHSAKEVVVIGDGAPWIWQLAAKQFGGAVQVVDFFHACQHLAALAETRFGPGSPASQEWQRARQAELKADQMECVLRQIAAWRPANEEKRRLRRNTYLYFARNRQRMRYQTFLNRGYHIGSGVVEAACKQVVAQRLDQAGMHWREENAEAIVTLRAAQLSSRPPDLRPHCAMPRATSRAATPA